MQHQQSFVGVRPLLLEGQGRLAKLRFQIERILLFFHVWWSEVHLCPVRVNNRVPAFEPSQDFPVRHFVGEQIKVAARCILVNPKLRFLPSFDLRILNARGIRLRRSGLFVLGV